MAESLQEIQAATKCLLDTGEGGDLILLCKGKKWKVHSSYLWPRSSWFKAACRGGFTESETQQIVLPEEEPSMVYRMLEYLYMQDYTVDLGFDPFWSVNDSWARTRLHVHAQMYSLGDKYDLRGLKKEAVRRFTDEIATPGGDKKRETRTLLSVMPTIYTTTPESDRGLRDLVARHIFQRYKTASKHFVKELDTALRVPQFARDIVVLGQSRPVIDVSALTKHLHRHWRHCLRTLRTAAGSFSNLAAASYRALATRITLNGIINLIAFGLAVCTTLILCFMLLAFLVALFLIGITKLEHFMDFAVQLQNEMCVDILTHDRRLLKKILALTGCEGTQCTLRGYDK